MRLRFLTAGESHGRGLVTIVEGLPSGLPISLEEVNKQLSRRQWGAGRGGRMKIERDQVTILSGVRAGVSLGSPIALLIPNKDWERWQKVMDPQLPGEDTAQIAEDSRLGRLGKVTIPRPGHADLAGGMKYNQDDLRNILERASARETAARVAAGALARALLARLGVQLGSEVLEIGSVAAKARPLTSYSSDETWQELEGLDQSPLRCADKTAEREMLSAIEQARENGDSLGGTFRVAARGLVPGLGSHVHWDRRLDGRLAQALMSIGSVKAVWVGLGKEAASLPGSRVHDPISYHGEYVRESNNAGGLEGGITTGEPLILGAALKPIPTLYQPLESVEIKTHRKAKAQVERSDTCVVPAAAVVAEAMVAWVLAEAYLEKFGGDTLGDLESSLAVYRRRLRDY